MAKPKETEEIFPAYEVVRCRELGTSFEERLQFSIAQLGIPTRLANALEENFGILWVEGLRGIIRERISKVSGIGEKSMAALDKKLAIAGIRYESNGELTNLFFGENGNGNGSMKKPYRIVSMPNS